MSADVPEVVLDDEEPERRAPTTLEEAGNRLVVVEQWLSDVDDLVGDLLQRQPAAPAAGVPPREPVAPRDEWVPLFGSLAEFVEGFFVVAFARTLGGPSGMWCAQWWDHAEAIMRLEALWRTFEAARLDPDKGMATWFAHHLDHHLPVLLSSSGPFGQCRPDEHRPPPPLPSLPAPEGWWEPMTHTYS
ncbi:uncharacterized protein DUF4913 [Motilibacter peucedani]|uniref:Uncharacterized protein DUF4913 n=1 Tax=Motilibacter peucedani TaxID=598650 RepID=A0A420XV53_9ACTN|nr:DUF4913 domain-containing protein [Motilibacter peucedani]RKS80630.1 uncharacterized protein DUF4913 [Motilibacter peucedani]